MYMLLPQLAIKNARNWFAEEFDATYVVIALCSCSSGYEGFSHCAQLWHCSYCPPLMAADGFGHHLGSDFSTSGEFHFQIKQGLNPGRPLRKL